MSRWRMFDYRTWHCVTVNIVAVWLRNVALCECDDGGCVATERDIVWMSRWRVCDYRTWHCVNVKMMDVWLQNVRLYECECGYRVWHCVNVKMIELVSWHFEPSQPQRIKSRLKRMFNLSSTYSARKSSNHKFSKNHKISHDTNLQWTKHTQTSNKTSSKN